MPQPINYQEALFTFLLKYVKERINCLLELKKSVEGPEFNRVRKDLQNLGERVILYEYSVLPLEKKISDLVEVKIFLQDVRQKVLKSQ